MAMIDWYAHLRPGKYLEAVRERAETVLGHTPDAWKADE